MKIKVLTDSSSDLPLSYINENSEFLEFLGMPITIGKEEHIDDLGNLFSHDYFYQQMSAGKLSKTSQINSTTFYDKFLENYEHGITTIYIGLSSGLSGTYNNANIAKNMVLEEAPSALIYVIDSLGASIGLGSLVHRAVEMVKEGVDVETCFKTIEMEKLYANHWFAVDDLIHLKNGGRIPAAAAYVGTVLSVKPVLTMTHEGKLESYASVRGKKKAFKYLVSKVVEHIGDSHTTIFVGHANDKADADIMIEELRSKGINNPVIETCLSATIASHVGPGMLAMAFMSKKNRE